MLVVGFIDFGVGDPKFTSAKLSASQRLAAHRNGMAFLNVAFELLSNSHCYFSWHSRSQ